MLNNTRKITLAYALSMKKQRSLDWTRFMELGLEHNIVALNVDLDKPLLDQGKFDILFCKLSAELNESLGLAPVTEKRSYRLKNISEYLKKFPQTQILDSLESQSLILTRDGMLLLLDALAERVQEVSVPRSFILTENNPSLPEDFPFPAFIKNITAGGCQRAHDMTILFNPDSLNTRAKPILVQEYINHSSTLYKVNVIGDESRISLRPSLRDFPSDFPTNREPLNFTHHNKETFSPLCGSISSDPALMKELSVTVKKISRVLCDISGLSLFGYDMIRCEKTGKYYVIDINYLPGYNSVGNIPEMLLNLVLIKISVKSEDHVALIPKPPTLSLPLFQSCYLENISISRQETYVTEQTHT